MHGAIFLLVALLASTVAASLPADWSRVLKNVLVHEGGNDDDPRDPGGRTSRGIIQREWNVWRRTHADLNLPKDVWRAPQDQIEAIYHQTYWEHPCIRGDNLPTGLSYSIADYGINSGVSRAGKVLRRVLDLDDSRCTVTDEVIAKIKTRNTKQLINQVNDERMRFLRHLGTFSTFGKGWTRRVTEVRLNSLRMAGPLGASGARGIPAMYGPGKAYDGVPPGAEEDEIPPESQP